MATPEKILTNKHLAQLDPKTERLFRINAGVGWAGKVTYRDANKIVLEKPRPLHAAPKGWPDLCGWRTVKITPDMVGQEIAVFVGAEVKATGNLSPDQSRFKTVLEAMGGIFDVVRAARK